MSRKIHLHIEHLSLPGYSPAERRAFIAALERELAGSIATGALNMARDASQRIVQGTAADTRPETVARSAVASLNLGTTRGRGRP